MHTVHQPPVSDAQDGPRVTPYFTAWLEEWAGPAALAWQDAALCAQADPDLFFPEKGESSRPAQRVCRACEVRAECLDYALSAGDRLHGVWGGFSERERRPLRRAS